MKLYVVMHMLEGFAYGGEWDQKREDAWSNVLHGAYAFADKPEDQMVVQVTVAPKELARAQGHREA